MAEHTGEPNHSQMMRTLNQRLDAIANSLAELSKEYVRWPIFMWIVGSAGGVLLTLQLVHWAQDMHWGAAEKAQIGATNQAVMQEMQRSIEGLAVGVSGLSKAVQENEAETAELRGYIRAKSGDSVQVDASELDARGG